MIMTNQQQSIQEAVAAAQQNLGGMNMNTQGTRTLTDAEFQQMVNAGMVQGVAPVVAKPKYEYQEIKDLCLPGISDEDKAKAIVLANQIELLNISINQRVESGVVVPKAEMLSLKNMMKLFKKITKSDFFSKVQSAAYNGTTSVIGVKNAFIGLVEDKTNNVITDLSDTTCNLIDNVELLATETLKFGFVFTKGVVKLVADTSTDVLKVGFNVIR